LKPPVEQKKHMVTVPSLLESLHRAGGTVRLDGGDLLVRFAATPPADLVEALRRHKPLIVAFLRGETICYDRALDEGDLPGDGSVPAEGSAPADGGGQVAADDRAIETASPSADGASTVPLPAALADDDVMPPPLGDAMVRLLDGLHRALCMVDVVGDSETLRSGCPACGRAGALDIIEGPDGVPHVWARCNCPDPLAGLAGLVLVPLVEFRGPQPARSDADLPEFPSRKLGAKQQTFAW
jgi:hypothetical protein